MNEPYMPKPSSVAATLGVQTGRRRIIVMSTSGSGERDSTLIHTKSSTAATTNSPITRGDAQPQAGPWLAPSSSAPSHDDSSAARSQFTRPPGLSGDSGTNKYVASAAMA